MYSRITCCVTIALLHFSTQQNKGYEPTVSICTKKINSNLNGEGIEIKVRDNGNGIPEKLLNKIFQPFFTTKPTGQETGLGLSLSYNIIKTLGGELKVKSREGDFAEFIIAKKNLSIFKVEWV